MRLKWHIIINYYYGSAADILIVPTYLRYIRNK